MLPADDHVAIICVLVSFVVSTLEFKFDFYVTPNSFSLFRVLSFPRAVRKRIMYRFYEKAQFIAHHAEKKYYALFIYWSVPKSSEVDRCTIVSWLDSCRESVD